MSQQQWFVRQGGQDLGPLTSLELKQLADTGKLASSDFVRLSNKSSWRQAGTVKGLFGTNQPATAILSSPSSANSGTVVIARISTLTGLFYPIKIAVDQQSVGELGGGFPAELLAFIFRSRPAQTISLPVGDYTVEITGGGATRRDIWHVNAGQQQRWTTFLSNRDSSRVINLIEEQPSIVDSTLSMSSTLNHTSPSQVAPSVTDPARHPFYRSASFWSNVLVVFTAMTYVVSKAVVYACTHNGGKCAKCQGTGYCCPCRGQKCSQCAFTGECQACVGTGRGHSY